MILYKYCLKIVKFSRTFFIKQLIKRRYLKKDLLIYDDIYPHPISGFRLEEFSNLLSAFNASCIITEPLSYPLVKTNVEYHKSHIEELIKTLPLLKKKIFTHKDYLNITTKLFYCVFLNNIYNNLHWLEKYNIPFVFTLYPGGGFQIDNEVTNKKLLKVLSSSQFKKVIVTQLFTKDYLIKHKYCQSDKIEYIFGCVVPQISFSGNTSNIEVVSKKDTFDVVFCAAKYMEKGVDKGYDVFIEVAHVLIKKYDNIRFHVIGGFDKSDIDICLLGDSIIFYGYQRFEDLAVIFKQMDVILSPNKPFYLDKGAFDGFPLGTVVEAVLNGVVAIVTDKLNQNTVFDDGKEIIITDGSVMSIENEISNLIDNPDKLKLISQNGKAKFEKIYSNQYQMIPRITLLKDEINNN